LSNVLVAPQSQRGERRGYRGRKHTVNSISGGKMITFKSLEGESYHISTATAFTIVVMTNGKILFQWDDVRGCEVNISPETLESIRSQVDVNPLKEIVYWLENIASRTGV
jgi:hypothetical protein